MSQTRSSSHKDPLRGRGHERRLLKDLFVFLIAVAMLLSALPLGQGKADGGGAFPAAVFLTVAPKTLPADGGAYAAVFVSLVDQSSLPTLPTEATTVLLTSSVTSVGLLLNSSIVIGPGMSYAVASVRTTATPGTTTITASSPGLKSATAVVQTAAPTGYPSVIAVSAVPSQVVPQAQYRGIMIVELEDSAGEPARAVSDMQVRLLSSNVNVLNVTDSITINSGNFSSTTSFFTGFVPGQALVTATSSGFTTGSTSVSVVGPAALNLELYPQPDWMVTCADNVTSCTGRLVIALTDQNGNPARATRQLTVQVRSSNTAVIQTPLNATIASGDISAIVPYTTTANAGNATITVSSPGLGSDIAVIRTSPYTQPVALKLFVGPNPVLADHHSYSSVLVALVNKTGGPAVNMTGPTLVTITSSLAATGNFSTIALTIPAGQNYVSTAFTSTFLVGSTTLTVSAQNLLPAFANLESAGAVPSGLIITPLSRSVPADGGTHPVIEVQLQDSFGDPALAPSDLPVYISSAVGQVVQIASPVVVPAGRSALLVNGTTSTVTGNANITAYANFPGSSSPTLAKSIIVTTVTPAPSAISAQAVPATFVLSKLQPVAELAVQLQDSQGNPARARYDIQFTVTSSVSGVVNQTLTGTIPQGDDLKYLALSPAESGTTEFTVASSGLASSSVDFAVVSAPVQATLSPTRVSIMQNQSDTMDLTLIFEGAGLPKANVTWQATGGTINPSVSETDSAGRSNVLFTPTATGIANVTAVISHPAFGDESISAQVIVFRVPPRQSPSVEGELLTPAPFVHVPYLAFVVAVAAVLLVVVMMRRGTKVEEVVEEGYETASLS